MAAAQWLGIPAYAGGVTANRPFTEERGFTWRVGSRWCSISTSRSSCSKENRGLGTRAAGAEFGARDPFPAEIESSFGDKVLGYGDTEHVILVPNAPALSLAMRSCLHPLPPGTSAYPLDQARALLRKIVGWRLVEEKAGLKLQCEWKLKDHTAGVELSGRLSSVAEAEKKPLELYLDDQTHILRAELWTESIGGLCENDYILAAKIDKVKTSDLIKKTRFWA